MKRLHFLDKILYILNVVLALALFLSYIFIYIPPNVLDSFALIPLLTPVFLVLNLLFTIYWLVKLRRQFLLSFFALCCCYKIILGFISFSTNKSSISETDFSVMTFNVRQLNLFNSIGDKNIPEQIANFITLKETDIVCLQEFSDNKNLDLSAHPYQHKISDRGLAIYSNLKVISSGKINFPNSYNGALYADILLNADTLRIYNIHLQSIGLKPVPSTISKEKSEAIRLQINAAFVQQQSQVEILLNHIKASPYRHMIVGDFNNTTHSYIFRKLKGDLKDSFTAAASGFGKSYDFKYFPIRIDFILANNNMEVVYYETYYKKLSDHYPVIAGFNFM